MLQTFFKKINHSIGILPFLCGGVLLIQSLPSEAAVRCSDMHVFKPQYFDLFAEQKNYKHSARIIGDEVNQENLRRSILELAGRFPIDERGCIGDRCTNANKDRYIAYLQQRIRDMGVATELETGESRFSSSSSGIGPKSTKKGKVNNNPGSGPVDFSEASRHFVQVLFSTKNTKLAGRFIRELGLNFDLDQYKKLNLPMMNAIIDVIRYDVPIVSGLAKFGLNPSASELKKTEFFTNEAIRRKTLEQLQNIRDRVKSGSVTIAEEAARKIESKNPNRRPDIINVIAEIKGRSRPQDIIEVSAHYDSISPDHPGADDNGSGLATMLEMIRIFKQYPPEKTIRFVFTDLEERGMQGSGLHVQKVVERRDRIYGALLIDTIGYHPLRENGDKPVFVLELGTPGMRPSKLHHDLASSFSDVLAWQFARYERYVRMSVETFGAKPGTADHGSYFSAGLPGVLAAAPYEGDFINPGYHKKSDVIEQYNWLYFMSIARAMTEGIAVAAGAKVTPADVKRVHPEVLAHYDVQYKNASPALDHKSEVMNKGGRSFSSGSGGWFPGRKKGGSSSSSGSGFSSSGFGDYF